MELKRIIAGVCLAMAANANAATVWLPTDGDVNQVSFELAAAGGAIALFNYDLTTNSIYPGQRLDVALSAGVGTVDFSDPGNTITSGANSLNLGTDGKYFAVGVSMDSGVSWTFDNDNPTNLQGNNWKLFFETASGTQTTVQIDATPYSPSTGPATVVPVPAAVWLFGSGLLGLVGIARRRRH
ncbi:MAG TPA: VPLPA-CTERM sorting domain-containing protein [Thiohalobacter sp.]|nr:VPLPA-CTERM sorting domain-containing protein [Thiohalobacter sp.]